MTVTPHARGLRRVLSLTLVTGLAAALVACSSGNPLEAEPEASSGSAGGSSMLRIGSAAFAENEIIAQIYAQALAGSGIDIDFAGQIGQRDVILKGLDDGSLDIVPEYSGNLLQALDPDAATGSPAEVLEALPAALPEGLAVLDAAEAANADSYVVTPEFAAEHDVSSLADLAGLSIPLAVGGNPELAQRPYGPPGLSAVYGVDAATLTFTPISDSGGPLTLAALLDGSVQLADIYSTTPSIAEHDLVVLDDPENMILAQQVVPLLSERANTPEVQRVLNEVSAELTTEDLIAMNARSQGEEKASAQVIAADWLRERGLG
ncbi:ABC transporter substrate-binding protein [Leucobacter sp. M11]|uniref:ABC transporter substrate-binding protein n=1 Tax=Leucobacter sp. M11 TaxID=2993565 RepID=UPI002D80DCC0|nr:ABC transporter substrate-binding protein [Leucobacter sp. M11]MEB4616474.1 ABC transporter substrate-binding protein [Leucobacter sp. M11]